MIYILKNPLYNKKKIVVNLQKSFIFFIFSPTCTFIF